MTSLQINIASFNKQYQSDIDILMEEIRDEFSESIAPPKLPINIEPIQLPDKYLVVLANNKVVGTITITKLKNDNSVLKRMFLNKNFRGQGIAESLLENVTNWAIENKLITIFLGTMTQFKAAQKFYEKHGFEKISLENLPNDFPLNPVDSIFYKKNL